jgi:integrase
MASISKRCDHQDTTRCRCRWVVRWRDANGRAREQSYLWDQKTLANARKTQVEHDLIAGQPTFTRRASSETFGALAETWIDRGQAESTKANYRSCLKQHVAPVLGKTPLANVTREAVQDLLLTEMPKTVGHSVIVMARTMISAVLAEAVRQHKIPENPALRIKLPNGESERAQFVMASRKQLCAVESALPDEWALALWLMRGCGMRIGEALAIRADSVRGDILRTEEQILATGKRGPLKHRKPGEFRDAPLPGYLADKITAHVALYGIAPDGYLFPEFADGLKRQRAFRDAFTSGTETAGLPDTFTAHDLRHTFASVALHNGIPITEVSRWLGHRDINTTHKIYGHMVPSAVGRAASVLDREYADWSDA